MSRHGGVGDIIMMLPIACHLSSIGHIVTLTASKIYAKWLTLLLNNVNVTFSGFDNFSTHDLKMYYKGFDVLLNYNRLHELSTNLSIQMNFEHVNYQYLMCLLAQMNGLTTPDILSPSAYFKPPTTNRTNSILICPSSSAEHRKIGEEFVEQLLDSIDNSHILDDNYEDVGELAYKISESRAVICTDSGPAHISELTHTPCICLMPSSTGYKVYHKYKFVKTIPTRAVCYPCFLHDGCEEERCVNDFDIDKILDAIRTI